MNLWFRIVLTLLRARFGQSLDPLGRSTVRFRVWPTDLDVNAHMNNGRYATLMDLGRVDLMARAGLLPVIRRERMYPVVTAQHILYRRSLNPFQAFTLETRILGVDERFAYLDQRFLRGETVHARGIVQALFLRPGKGRVPTGEMMTLFGVHNAPELPSDVPAMFPTPDA